MPAAVITAISVSAAQRHKSVCTALQMYSNDSEKGNRPSVKPAREFHLIRRQNGSSPVTMWEPLPPQGYRALGTVLVPDAEQPGSSEVLCVREDLCSKTGIFDSPVWKSEPPVMQVRHACLVLMLHIVQQEVSVISGHERSFWAVIHLHTGQLCGVTWWVL